VECWNGVRGIDYLLQRPEVDPRRIAVTGISGGGAATFWIAAADERAAVAVPVSGMADLPSYVTDRVINGHCDCMFLYNTYRWPWTRIAGLIAPRPLLFVNSDADPIFPMDANQRVINRLERLYSFFGAGDMVDSVVSIGGHAYRQDIRRAACRFINIHLTGETSPVEDSEVDLVSGPRAAPVHPIEPAELRVFPRDEDIPADELNTTIDQHFVPMAQPAPPREGEFATWRQQLVEHLRRDCFGYFPDQIPAAQVTRQPDDTGTCQIETEPGIEVPLQCHDEGDRQQTTRRILLLVTAAGSTDETLVWARDQRQTGDALYQLQPRGVGPTRWTRNNPPNYVERSHVLLGRTVDTGRIWDVIAAARYLRNENEQIEVHVVADGNAALLAAYGAMWDDAIAGAILRRPPMTHMDGNAPQVLNVLRVCDVPEVLGMIAPRPLTVYDVSDESLKAVSAIYAAAGSALRFP
jgi:hypothetical protein